VPVIGAIFYGVVMLLAKNEIVIEVLQTVTGKIKK